MDCGLGESGRSMVGAILILLFMAGMLPTLMKVVGERQDWRDRASDKLPGKDAYVLEGKSEEDIDNMFALTLTKTSRSCLLIDLGKGCFCLAGLQCVSGECAGWYCE